MSSIHNNTAEQRYETSVDGEMAIAAYREAGGVVTFTHTEVPEALQGHGIGGQLVSGAIADVRRRGLRVVPACAFVAAWFDDHPQAADLLAEGAARTG